MTRATSDPGNQHEPSQETGGLVGSHEAGKQGQAEELGSCPETRRSGQLWALGEGLEGQTGGQRPGRRLGRGSRGRGQGLSLGWGSGSGEEERGQRGSGVRSDRAGYWPWGCGVGWGWSEAKVVSQ